MYKWNNDRGQSENVNFKFDNGAKTQRSANEKYLCNSKKEMKCLRIDYKDLKGN